jgi:DUF1680 family protein
MADSVADALMGMSDGYGMLGGWMDGMEEKSCWVELRWEEKWRMRSRRLD